MTTATEILAPSTPTINADPASSAQQPTTEPAKGWWDSVQDAEVKGWLANKKYENPDIAYKSAWSMEKLMGAEKAGRTVVLPKDEKDVEGLKAFNAKLGVPETPDGYKLPLPTGDDGVFAKTASTWFHEAGVPAKAAEKIATKWNEFIAGEVQKQEATEKQNAQVKLDALKVEWGHEFDQRAEFARRGLADFGQKAGLDDKDLKALEVAIGTDKMLKMFHELGTVNKEAAFNGGDAKGTFGLTPDQAQKEVDQIMADRASGKINDYQWRTEYEAKMYKLGQIVAQKLSAQQLQGRNGNGTFNDVVVRP